jgi:hypothetical protein
MYFKEFPSFLYDFKHEDGTVRTEIVKDVTRNVRIKKDILSNIALYDEYDLVDGDTPEIIAEKFYGNPEYHWVVMLTNEKFDWLADYPLTETEITKHIIRTYNPVMHSDDWKVVSEYHAEVDTSEQRMEFTLYDNALPLDPDYLTAVMTYTITGQTEFVKFNYSFDWPDYRHDEPHNGLIRETQVVWQILPYPIGSISCLPSSPVVTGTNSAFTTNLLVGMDLYTKSGVKIGRIKSIENDSSLTLDDNSTVAVTNVKFDYKIPGNPVGELTITTTGREKNPVHYVNSSGYIVNPGNGAIPITGEDLHRIQNDEKRKIKLVSPALIETVIKNFEELL